jgi:hypothetical protein
VSAEIAAFAASVQNPAMIGRFVGFIQARIDPIDPLDGSGWSGTL